MPVIIDEKGTLFKPFKYPNEEIFETDVVRLADQIFGSSTIYVDIKKRIKGGDVLSIPDGYVIDMAEPDNPNLFIVENEIASHDPFRHIGIQMLKFVTSFTEARVQIRQFLMEDIAKNKKHLRRLKEGCDSSSSRNIDNYLDRIVFADFKGLVVIDDAANELYGVLQKINANISVLELKTFESGGGFRLHQFDTLYDEYEEGFASVKVSGRTSSKHPAITKEERILRRTRRAESDTIIVPSREEGFKKVFLGENRWYAIRVGAAMKEKIKYIAAYQVAPVSAITHVATVHEIIPYKDTGKYEVVFNGKAKKIKSIKLRDAKYSPQGPVYVSREKLMKSSSLEKALK